MGDDGAASEKKGDKEQKTPKVVYLFVDDSNLWIEGQKAMAQQLQLHRRSQDVRFRVNLKQLLVFVERQVGPIKENGAHLFVSRSPHARGVFDKAAGLGFNVHMFERSQGSSHHEKEVDQALCVEIAFQAALSFSEKEKNVAFAIVTGDRDIRPAIQKALKCNIPVHLFAFSSGLSSEYGTVSAASSIFSTTLLDRYAFEIGFLDYWSSGGKLHTPALAVVVTPVEAQNHVRMHQLCRYLHELHEQFFIATLTPTALGIEFPCAQVDHVLVGQINKVLEAAGISARVLPYFEWAASMAPASMQAQPTPPHRQCLQSPMHNSHPSPHHSPRYSPSYSPDLSPVSSQLHLNHMQGYSHSGYQHPQQQQQQQHQHQHQQHPHHHQHQHQQRPRLHHQGPPHQVHHPHHHGDQRGRGDLHHGRKHH